MNWLSIPTEAWTTLTYAGAVLSLVAGFLIARAARGTPVGWQPVCRRCEHDLRTVDPSKGTCPECGADLSRPAAVRTGGSVRRVRPIVAAVLATALAGGAVWWVTPTRVYRWRMDLIGSMPFDQLVDLAISGLGDRATQQLATNAIDSRLGGWNQQGAQRSIPSGELLDALVKALARAGEPGRTPLAAVIDGAAGQLLRRLDDAERARLVELAADEMIASRGATTDLARCAAMIDRFGGSFEDVLIDRIAARLRTTEEGRAALASRVSVNGPASTGGLVKVALQGPLDSLRRNIGSLARNPDTIIIEAVEATPEAEGSGSAAAAPIPLRAYADLDVPPILVDLAPGRYRLRIKGVVALTALVPTRDLWGGQTVAAISLADAAKLDGARVIDETITLEVGERSAAPAPFVRLSEQGAVEAFATRLKGSRFEVRGGSNKSFELASPPRDRMGRSSGPGYRFALMVRQGEKTHRLGSMYGLGGGSGMSGGPLPNSVDSAQPFELVLDPLEYPSGGSRLDQMLPMQGARIELLWARFTLRFANAAATPEVVAEPLDDTPIVATAVAREEAREIVGESAGRLARPSRLGRLPRSSDAAQVMISFGAVSSGAPASASGASEAAAMPRRTALLAGLFELRASGALLAPVSTSIVVLGPQPTSMSFTVGKDADAIYPRTLRYTPDPAFALAEQPVSFRYIAEPFELRFTDASTPPELVWLAD
jgi:hypothetical protein